MFDLCSLETHRELYSISFICDIVHYRIKCDVLVSLLKLYFPARALRETLHFRLPKLKSNFALNNPIFRFLFITNKIITLIFNNVSPETFKKNTVIENMLYLSFCYVIF